MGWCQDKPRSPEQQAEGSQAQRLIFAVTKGNSDIVRSLLAGGINPNVSKKDGTCALHAASSTAWQSGTLECATLLLEQGADANQPDRYGNSPLMEAARQPSAEMVELLLAHGATPTATSFQGMTALMRGCVDGCSATSRALLLGRADPQQISPRNGDHALAMAVRGGHIDCVKLLLEFGVTADLRSGNGVTALMVCCTLQQLECAHELVAGRADVNATDDHGTSVLLHTAGHGHEDCVKLVRFCASVLTVFIETRPTSPPPTIPTCSSEFTSPLCPNPPLYPLASYPGLATFPPALRAWRRRQSQGTCGQHCATRGGHPRAPWLRAATLCIRGWPGRSL